MTEAMMRELKDTVNRLNSLSGQLTVLLRLVEDLLAERALADQLAVALVQIQFGSYDLQAQEHECPHCRAVPTLGHDSDCLVGVALARYRAARQPDA